MNVSIRLVGSLVLGALCGSHVAEAQFLPTPPVTTNARVRLGPFELSPTISLTNIGVDTNLFNEADAAEPQQDMALTFAPQTDIAARLGRTWLIAEARQDLIWFRQYQDQRSSNGFYRGGWYVPLNRMKLLMEATYLRSRQRPGFEIDLRADRREHGAVMATEVRAWSRTFLGARVEQRDVKFRDGALFGGRDLSEELNRKRTTGTASFRYELTPMTSLALEASYFDEQFAAADWRSSSSTQLAGGLRFDPSALIKGHVLVGYRELTSRGQVVPPYVGPTLAANVSYVAAASTRLELDVARDVEYSFDPQHPYYVLSGVAGAVTRRLFGPVDVQARLGWRTLGYRARTDVTLERGQRNDRVITIGESFGYRLGRGTRLTFDVETQRRTSPVVLRNYRGGRYGLSIIWAP